MDLNPSHRHYWYILILFLLVCACKKAEDKTEITPFEIKKEENSRTATLLDTILENNSLQLNSRQVIVTYAPQPGGNTGPLFGYEKKDGNWEMTLDTVAVNFGQAGFAPVGEKREGDKRSPTGVFALGPAYGYQKDLDCSIDFIELTDEHYWISDSKSADYNKLVTYLPESKEVEKMRRKDDLYKYGIVIRYNMDKVEPHKGSAIFIHVWRQLGMATLGCISMPEAEMIDLIQWLDPAKQPVIIMGDYPLKLSKHQSIK